MRNQLIQIIFDEVNSDQLMVKNHFIFQKKDIKNIIVFNFLLGKMLMVIKSKMPKVNKNAI